MPISSFFGGNGDAWGCEDLICLYEKLSGGIYISAANEKKTAKMELELYSDGKKAGAIVANEGGINSHAAIVSRELGISGIVNAKIATQVLKDGDIVEVDADSGTVKIIEKAA